jgi:hypothetical protein
MERKIRLPAELRIPHRGSFMHVDTARLSQEVLQDAIKFALRVTLHNATMDYRLSDERRARAATARLEEIYDGQWKLQKP